MSTAAVLVLGILMVYYFLKCILCGVWCDCDVLGWLMPSVITLLIFIVIPSVGPHVGNAVLNVYSVLLFLRLYLGTNAG